MKKKFDKKNIKEFYIFPKKIYFHNSDRINTLYIIIYRNDWIIVFTLWQYWFILRNKIVYTYCK